MIGYHFEKKNNFGALWIIHLHSDWFTYKKVGSVNKK